MPSRPSPNNGLNNSPQTLSNAFSDVVGVLQRKLAVHHPENSTIEATLVHPPSRRGSFSMDNLLHINKKDKKRDASKDRETRNDKKKPLILGSTGLKSKESVAGKNGQNAVAPKPARFETTIESSPLVMIHSPTSSTGALLSTKIKLIVEDPSGSVTLNSWTRTLRAVSTTKKPVGGKDCHACTKRHDVLSKADIITKPKTYHASEDNFVPFQFLFEGHLPATTHSQLGSIEYELVLDATTSTGQTLSYSQPLTLQRAIPEGPLKSSVRIFPPTNLTGRVQMPPVVHPIGTFPINLTMCGVVDKTESAQTRWRLRKLTWRVEEHSTVTSTPCPKHVHKVHGNVPGDENGLKAIQHTDSRQLGSGEMKSGWKSDFDTIGGEIQVEFAASVVSKPSHKAVCDVESASGLTVTHNLVVELIVAEEFCPNKNTNMITPTGAARVLRMQFALVVTERAGMGISWDEEMPPRYDDVPGSPPGYGSADRSDGAWGGAEILDYHGPALEYTELERLQNPDPNAPPSYRERDPAEMLATSEAGPSGTNAGRSAGWTEEDLSGEPQPWRRRRSSTEAPAPQEAYAEGSTDAAPGGR